MNWNTIENNWGEIKEKVHTAWTKLTDEDIEAIEGSREELLERIQHRYGYAREKASAEINSFLMAHEKHLS